MTSAEATTAEEHPLIGQTLRGTYRVLSVLDQGGMGLVFEAEHTRLRRRVAVKVLAQHLIRDAQALARFNREAEIISQLEHANIVQVLDFDTTEQGEPYLVMELLKGESLLERLEREGHLAISETVHVVQQVASGLFAAHQASIVHRDLKPANIFLTKLAGEGARVKLLDFGISKRAGAGRSLTGEFDVLGTPDYMAPEQALGKTANVDHRGDQYALAVITYEMLCGQTPFSGTDVLEVLHKVVSTDAPPIESLAPHVPRNVSAVLQRGLQKSPEARYETVLHFARAFALACEPDSSEGFASARTIPASGDDSLGRGEPESQLRSTARLSPSSASAWDPPGSLGPRPPSTPRVGRPPQTPNPTRAAERVKTGQQHRAAANRFGNASTLAGNASLQDIPAALERARQALGLGDLNLAVAYAESALRVAEAFDNAEARLSIDSESMLIDHILETRIGSLSQQVRVVVVPSSQDSRVSPEQAFLLSRLDGGATVEEVLDLSPMSRRDTLRIVLSLLRDGLIALGELRSNPP